MSKPFFSFQIKQCQSSSATPENTTSSVLFLMSSGSGSNEAYLSPFMWAAQKALFGPFFCPSLQPVQLSPANYLQWTHPLGRKKPPRPISP